ncbi:FecR domain-containing protein [Persephonella sp.]
MKAKSVFLGFIFSFVLSFAQEVGNIVKYKGSVKVYRENIIKPIQVLQENFPLVVKDIVKTKSRSTAYIKFIDGSKVVLTEKSSISIEDYQVVSADKGRVFFKIRKRGDLRGLKVKARSVVIGVKGTKFMVDLTDDSMNIFLKEGLITVRSLIGEFIRYKEKEISEFESFKEKELGEYEKYKKEMEEEYKEFVKEFQMEAGTAVSIKNGEVRNIKIPPEIEREFELLDRF